MSWFKRYRAAKTRNPFWYTPPGTWYRVRHRWGFSSHFAPKTLDPLTEKRLSAAMEIAWRKCA